MKVLTIGLVMLLVLPSLFISYEKTTTNNENEVLVIAGIPFTERKDLGIPKPSWKEVEEILPVLKDVGVNAIFIWAPYEHRIVAEGNITAYTEKGEIKLNLSHCVHIKNYLKPDPERGSEEDFLHMVEAAHSLGIKVIAQLQITVAIPGDFVYDKHFDWILKSIYDKPAVLWPWPAHPHGFIVNKQHPELINYVTNVILPHWIKNWSLDGIYLDSPGMAYCDLYIKNLNERYGCASGYECLTPVDGYYSPEPLVKAMKNRIEELEKEVGRDLIFCGESSARNYRDVPDDVIIEICHGEPQAYIVDPRVNRSMGKYFDWIQSYNFRAILKDVYQGGDSSYSEDYVSFIKMIENELEGRYTETTKFVNMWVYFQKYTSLLKPEVVDCFITLQATSPGNIMWIGVYQLPPQADLVGDYFGYNTTVLKELYAKLIRIKRMYKALQSRDIENALISPNMKKLIAYNRWIGDESVTVMANLNDKPITCTLKTRFKGDRVYDVLSGEVFEGNPNGLKVGIPALTSRILVEKYPIDVEIKKPRENHLYIFDREMIPFPSTLIIGAIRIEGYTESLNETDGVEFYVDDVLKFTDYDEPYAWLWNEFVIGKHEIKVIAYDTKGNEAEDEIDVIIFNLGGIR